MDKIEHNSKNPFVLLKSKMADFRSEICFKIRNFLTRISKDMCFSKEELEEIKNRVETTKQKEEKFNEFREIAPDILARIRRLEDEKMFCINGIRELYLADKNGDEDLKKEIFLRFGLPHILEENNLI